MFKKSFVLLTAFPMVFAIACGESAEPAQYGTLDVQALGLVATAEGVNSVVVELKGQVRYEIELEWLAERGQWAGTFENVLAGRYDAQAFAYGEASGEGDALFTSVVKDYVVGGSGQSLAFVLNQDVPSDVDVPRFLSIALSRPAIEVGGDVDITVRVQAKSLGLSGHPESGFCGRYSGSDTDPDSDGSIDAFWPPNCSSDFSNGLGGSNDPNYGVPFDRCEGIEPDCWTATITWTANNVDPGTIQLVIQAFNDEAITEMDVVIVVTPAQEADERAM